MRIIKGKVTEMFWNTRISRALILICSVVFAGLVMSGTSVQAGDWPDGNRLYNIEDASGMFNERGFANSNSFSLDGNEVVNDFNGNLMYSQRLVYLPISENGIHLDCQLTYNGSVGHTTISARADGQNLVYTPLNLPEWIISLNNIAVQTFNFENEMISWESEPANPDNQINISEDAEVAALIQGYHSCYKEANANNNGVISILLGDGSVKELYSETSQLNPILNMKSGVYNTLSKDDADRGYLWRLGDDRSGQFTLFRSDGTKVHFDIFFPAFRTCQDNIPNNNRDYPRMLIPVEFEDQMGHVIQLSYDYTVDSETVWGRPIMSAIGEVDFSWSSWAQRAEEQRLIVRYETESLWVLHFASVPPDYDAGIDMVDVSWASGANRGLVYSIEDAEHRSTAFKYRSYRRSYDELTFGWHFGSKWDRSICAPGEEDKWGGNILNVEPWRLWNIDYPQGGNAYFQYYQDASTAWGQFAYLGSLDDISVPYDHTDNCYTQGGLVTQFPCKKSNYFEITGRDPFYQNMVVGIRRTNNAGPSPEVVTVDSLLFTWNDVGEVGAIDIDDELETTRYTGEEAVVEIPGSDPPQIKERFLRYRYYPEKGPLSSKSRDRGWALKLEYNSLSNHYYSGFPLTTENFWDIGCNGLICGGTFQLDSSTTIENGESRTTSYEYHWFGDPADEKVNNLSAKYVSDPWGIKTMTFYQTYFMFSDFSAEEYYNSSLIRSVTVRRVSDGRKLAESTTEHYVGSPHEEGYEGQVKAETRYLLHKLDPELHIGFERTQYTYATGGSLASRVDPNGNTIYFYYPDSPTEVVYSEKLAHDGTIDQAWREESFLDSGPFWYKARQNVGPGLRKLEWYRKVDKRGRLLWLVGPNYYRSEVSYDNLNRAESIILPGGFIPPGAQNDTSWSIDYVYADSEPVNVRQRIRVDKQHPSIETRTWFDGLYRIRQTDFLDPGGSYDSVTSVQDFASRQIVARDQENYPTFMSYDHRDRLINTTYPDQSSSTDSAEYSVTNAVAVGLDTRFSFNNDYILQKKFIDENGHEVIEYYDVREKLRQRKTFADGSALSTYFNYDDLGNLTLVIKPEGDSIRSFYNSLGQLVERQCADFKRDGSTPTYGSTYYQYDKNGNVVAVSTPNMNFDRTLVEYEWQYTTYDELNRVREIGLKTPTQTPWEYEYIPYYRYFYDDISEIETRGNLYLAYHLDPNQVSNYAEQFRYDGRGRVIRKEVFFNAIIDSNLNTGDWTWDYDAIGEPLALQYTYDWADNLKSITYPDGSTVRYGYDSRGRITAVGGVLEEDSTKYAQLTYTQRDELEQMNLGRGLQVVDYDYNERGWLESINDGTSSSQGAPNDVFGQAVYYYQDPIWQIFDSQYNGNVLAQSISINGQSSHFTYDYDESDRLRLSVRTVPGLQGFESHDYDRNGNITDHFLNNPHTGIADEQHFSYENQSNRLSRVGRWEVSIDDSLFYDPNGNVSRHSGKKADFFYDIYNRLSEVHVQTDLGIDTVWFGYDSAGDRIYKKYFYHYRRPCQWEFTGPMGGGEIESFGGGPGGGGPGDTTSLWCTYTDTKYTYYVRGTGKVLAELSGVSPAAYTNKFVYAGGSRIAMRDQTGKLHYFLNDHLGSTRVVLDSTGVVKDKHQYFAFGESWFEETNTNQSYRYTGKPLDSESGLDIYYYGARYYDPELGRFLGIDPLASKYPSWSPYAYAADNPLRNVDPNGKVVETVIDVASVGMSAVDLYNDPSWANAGWLALDVVSAAIPFVPAVGAVRHAAKLGGVVKAIGLTGDASKTAKKIQTVANEAETVVGGAGHVAGSKKHTAFAKGVNDLNQPGLKVEQSFKAGGKAKYGTKGSTRIDAVQYDASGKPTTAYDLKTGNAKLTPARAAEFREATGNLKLEVVEVKPDQP